ncbi:MAG: ABC transporter permease [Verrucomicrobia bacterium]|nr:ABC transporter permease [Verrucomicrobiota bacterium]
MQSKTDTAQVLLPSRGSMVKFQWQDYVVYLFFGLVLVFFGITLGNKGFLTVENLFNITRSTSMIVVMAVAMTFVICCGELDLSVGSTAGLAALTAGYFLQAYGTVAGILAALLCGLVVGLANGLFVTVGNIPSFLVTLGMMQLVRGLDMRVTYTKPILITNDFFNNVFGSGSVGPLPSLFIWSVLIAVIGHLVLRYTAFGREVLATGGNRTAAEYSGVNTKRVKLYCFLISGAAAGLAGMLYSGMMQTARYSFGTGAELAVIAATILGGTSLFGGKGTIIGTFVGALLIGTINNGLIIMGLDVSEQNIIAGAIIIIAVAFGRKPVR